jgi:predicted SprT family Zn-dependent metalloprotease
MPQRAGVTEKVQIRHYAVIELAEHIITNEYRLVNTLAHEFCHLANFMISNVHDRPHSKSFKAWGQKCGKALRDHPIYGSQILVTTRHSYDIDYKYF